MIMALPLDRPYLIGETAFHHEGDIDFLKELVRAFGKVGCDAVKFHMLLDLPDYMVERHPARPTLDRWSLATEDWLEMVQEASQAQLDIVILCNDVASIHLVKSIESKVRALEIHATGINDVFLLSEAASFHGTIILGTGGCSMDEIHFAVNHLMKDGHDDIFLMHGFQNYPTNYRDIELARIRKLQDFFGLPVGYADHTDPQDPNNSWVSAAPMVLGVNVIEKHITTNPGTKRTDGQAAIGLERVPELRSAMETLYAAAGAGTFNLSEAEMRYGQVGPIKKALVARRFIKAGSVLELEDIAFRRTPETAYIQQRDIMRILGSRVLKNFAPEALLIADAFRDEGTILDMSAFEQDDHKEQ